MTDQPTCWIVGAGDFYAPAFHPTARDFVIAADGGYGTLKDLGAPIDLVMGDFDSLGYRPDHPHVRQFPSMKDDTDMMLAVKEGLSRNFRRFELLGGLGGRLAHTLANLQALMYLSQHGARGVLRGAHENASAITDGSVTFPAECRGYVSLFCLSGRAEGVTLKGLKYAMDDGVLESSVALGVSNEFIGSPASVTVKRGTLILLWQTQRTP
ncbi:MAG: thiamine diphosphokinase [Pyramidobacter sp.]|jgi:thiamine pyrophosphokinase